MKSSASGTGGARGVLFDSNRGVSRGMEEVALWDGLPSPPDEVAGRLARHVPRAVPPNLPPCCLQEIGLAPERVPLAANRYLLSL